MGPAVSYVRWMPALLQQQQQRPGPNDDQPYRHIILGNILYFTQYCREENFMLSYTKRLRLLGDDVPPLAPDPLTGLYP